MDLANIVEENGMQTGKHRTLAVTTERILCIMLDKPATNNSVVSAIQRFSLALIFLLGYAIQDERGAE